MTQTPDNIKDFTALTPWWRTNVPTEIICSGNGVGDLLSKLLNEGRTPFFIIDGILQDQEKFAPVFGQNAKFIFDASASEPRTGDVDKTVALIKENYPKTDVVVGVGGGGTMDLAKAAGICLANDKPAQFYQGYSMDMNKGADIWVLPTLAGTGAEVTPIAVLRGPEKKLGINHAYTAASVAVIDPLLTEKVKKFNRFFTMMDCYFHHYEIIHSHTSAADAKQDSVDGLRMAKEVLEHDLGEFRMDLAIKSAMTSVLGGSSSIGGRVGAAHAISYGLSNSSPKLPHSVAVTISMLALEELYPDGCADTVRYLDINGMQRPTAHEYGIGADQLEKMTITALGMEKLWASCFGENWQSKVGKEFIENIYKRILAA